MRSGARVLLAAGLAAVSLTCSDRGITGTRSRTLTRLPIAPAFQQAAEGGPRIAVVKIRGVLRGKTGGDSTVVEAPVAGDSAVLEFANVSVIGDSALFALAIKAFDKDNLLVFEGAQDVTVKPGENKPAAPALAYSAPDAAVDHIVVSPKPVALDWAGAKPGDVSCLNRVPSQTAHTQQQVSVVGKDASNSVVPDVRVGWTSRDTTVATVDASGLIAARCSNKSTYVVARTFLGKADSVPVTVSAPPFALLMSADSVSVARGDDVQLTARFVDENNNPVSVTNVSWSSSDTGRATVSSTGLVHGIANGRVLITARAGDRQTVAVAQVVRPRAARVEIVAPADSVAVGQHLSLSASAYDRIGDRILDASGYRWTSMTPSIASVSTSGGVAGLSAGTAYIVAGLDEVADTIQIRVIASTTGGVTARVVDAATGAPLAGVLVSSVSNPNNATTSDAEGRFTLSGLAPGEDLSVAKSSYAAVTQYNLRVQLGQVITLADIPMAVAGGSGTVNGHVVNALNDAPIAGAIVKLFPGIDPRSADPGSGVTTPAVVAETTTDTNGVFSFASVTSGTYTLAAGASGFTVGHSTVAAVGGTSQDAGVFLSPSFSGTGLRVVLTWGDCNADPNVPCDLDSHLTGPTSPPDSGRFHIAYYQQDYVVNADTVATLDNDAVDGIGPETVTLHPLASGVYKYYVHDYTDGLDTISTRLANFSHARVDVYSNGKLVATFFPPRDGLGTVWAVFEYDGTTITGVNQMLSVDVDNPPGDFIRAAGSASPTDPSTQLVRELRGAPRKP